LVPVASETNFGAGPSQKYFGHGPGPKKNILVLVLFRKNFGTGPSQKNFGPGPGPGQKKKFGPGPGTTLPISIFWYTVMK
jgi:hypothetical protein